MDKLVYFFAKDHTDGNAGMKDLLGGKGTNLAEMTSIGIPVPPGFTLSPGPATCTSRPAIRCRGVSTGK